MKAASAAMIDVLTEVRGSLERSEESDWAALTPLEVIAILGREIASLHAEQRFIHPSGRALVVVPSHGGAPGDCHGERLEHSLPRAGGSLRRCPGAPSLIPLPRGFLGEFYRRAGE